MIKKTITIILLILIVITITACNTKTSNEEDTEAIMACIASSSTLYVKTGCPHCDDQKELFNEHLDKFTIVNCADEQQKCIDDGIFVVPTWIINNEHYEGVHEINELRALTNC